MQLQRIGPFWLPGAWLRDDWLISPSTSRLFLFSAICVIALTPIIEGWLVPSRMTFWMRVPWTVLVLVGVPALFFLWLGMWRYWVRLDDSSVWAKRAWFLILLIGFWWGSFLYYFCVYLPQLFRRRREET